MIDASGRNYGYGPDPHGSPGIGTTADHFTFTYEIPGVDARTRAGERRPGLRRARLARPQRIHPAGRRGRADARRRRAPVPARFLPPERAAGRGRRGDPRHCPATRSCIAHAGTEAGPVRARSTVEVNEALVPGGNYRLWVAFNKPMRIRDGAGAVVSYAGQSPGADVGTVNARDPCAGRRGRRARRRRLARHAGRRAGRVPALRRRRLRRRFHAARHDRGGLPRRRPRCSWIRRTSPDGARRRSGDAPSTGAAGTGSATRTRWARPAMPAAGTARSSPSSRRSRDRADRPKRPCAPPRNRLHPRRPRLRQIEAAAVATARASCCCCSASLLILRKSGLGEHDRESAPIQDTLAADRWVRIAILAAGYTLTGIVGLSLAVPPGYATAVWPPSGIALAAVLLWGPRVWPGIAAGSVLVNLGGRVDHRRTSRSTAIERRHRRRRSRPAPRCRRSPAPAPSGAGSASPRLFESGPATLLFTGIAAVACLVASTWGVATLSVAGVVRRGQFLDTWQTWWLGDLIGMMVFAPVFLTWRQSLQIGRKPWRLGELIAAFALLAPGGRRGVRRARAGRRCGKPADLPAAALPGVDRVPVPPERRRARRLPAVR